MTDQMQNQKPSKRQRSSTTLSTQSDSTRPDDEESPTLPQIPEPPPLSSEDWEIQATDDELSDALFRLALEIEPGIIDHKMRFAAFKDRLRQRGYARAEIQFAVDRLADDPDLTEHLHYPGSHLSAGDFRRVIEPLRKIRSKLKGEPLGDKRAAHQKGGDQPFRSLTEEEVEQAVEMLPELTFEDFGSRSGTNDEPRYMLLSESREEVFGE